MKQTMEEAAHEYMVKRSPEYWNGVGHYNKNELLGHILTDFIEGANSEVARELHTQGMYSKDDMISFGVFYYTHQGKDDEYWGQDLFKVWKEKNGKP